jgi:hypothetical protein
MPALSFYPPIIHRFLIHQGQSICSRRLDIDSDMPAPMLRPYCDRQEEQVKMIR